MEINVRNFSSHVNNRDDALYYIRKIIYTKGLDESLRNAYICDCILAAFPEKHDYLLHFSCVVLATEVDQFYNTNIADEFYNMEV